MGQLSKLDSMALVKRSAFDIWWDFVCPFQDWAHGYCKSAEDEIVHQRLPALDWELYVVAKVPGLMENCGTFADAAGAYAEHEAVMRTGLIRFGCPMAASLLPDCIALTRDFDKAPGWTDDFEARRNAIEAKADWSYGAVVSYLVAHAEDYSFSILPYCRLGPTDTLSLVR